MEGERVGGRLYVDFCGEGHVVSPPDSLSFGRAADLEVDDNPYLHRVVGRFDHRNGHWVLGNVGASTVLNVTDHDGATAVALAPGRSLGLAMAEFSVAFVAGRTRYEIDAALEEIEDPLEADLTSHGGQSTLEWGVVELNDDQRTLLVDLAAGRLSDPHAGDWAPDPKGACARRLGWSLSKYNRKLDHLCEKLDRAGVPGLCGAEGVQASDRRRLLVEHAVTAGLVTRADLDR